MSLRLLFCSQCGSSSRMLSTSQAVSPVIVAWRLHSSNLHLVGTPEACWASCRHHALVTIDWVDCTVSVMRCNSALQAYMITGRRKTEAVLKPLPCGLRMQKTEQFKEDRDHDAQFDWPIDDDKNDDRSDSECWHDTASDLTTIICDTITIIVTIMLAPEHDALRADFDV